jgi:AcrR family transcriptional regulator
MPLRRDAQRNLDRVLAAAEQVLAERGLDATLEEIAGAAGVGVGTIYRRFPSKDALLDAVFERRVDSGLELLRECEKLPSAWDGLCAFLRVTVAAQSSDQGLHEFLYGGSADRLRQRMEPPLTTLVERAKAEGKLRADFRATDIPLLIMMFSRLAHTHRTLGPAMAARYLEILLKGLAPGRDETPIPPPADDAALVGWLAGFAADSPAASSPG